MTQHTHTIYPGTHPIVDKIIQDLLEQLALLELCNLGDRGVDSGKKNNVSYTPTNCSPRWGGKGGLYILTSDTAYVYRLMKNEQQVAEIEIGMECEEGKEKEKDSSAVSQKISQKILEVFAYWQSVLNHPRAKFDKKRKKMITDALKMFEVAELKKAIDGCRLSKFHMGENDRCTKYTSISIIFGRGAEQTEKFIELASSSVSNPYAGMIFSD